MMSQFNIESVKSHKMAKENLSKSVTATVSTASTTKKFKSFGCRCQQNVKYLHQRNIYEQCYGIKKKKKIE